MYLKKKKSNTKSKQKGKRGLNWVGEQEKNGGLILVFFCFFCFFKLYKKKKKKNKKKSSYYKIKKTK